jgi:uncharacterized membrane protein
VVVAGVFGGITAKTSILVTQALPAALAVIAVLVATRPVEDAPEQAGS